MGEVKNISICIDIVELAELKQTNCEVLLKRERNGYASFSCAGYRSISSLAVGVQATSCSLLSQIACDIVPLKSLPCNQR